MKTILIAVFTLTALNSLKAQDTNSLKRTPYTLRLAVDTGTFYEVEIGATDYIFPNNGMQIYPGETIYAEATLEHGKIKKLTAVRSVTHPDITFTIKFSQQTEDKKHSMMMLSIKNPFSKDLTYEANMFLMKRNKWYPTDVLPVGAGLSTFETWPDVIISLALSEFRLADK